MNQINFLPESYRRVQRKRGRLLRRVALVGSVAGCVVLASIALKAKSIGQSRTADRLEQTVEAERGAIEVISGVEKQYASLLKRSQLKRVLIPPVSYHDAIGALSDAMPPEIAVTELIMTSVNPEPEPIETDAQREARLKRSATPPDEPAPYEPHLINIELEGLAPDDMAVANLVAALDTSRLFSRVTMRSSRAAVSRGMQVRQFSLTAVIDLDREFDWTQTKPEVAYAD
ncbi:MAG: PilN domain-containing protein [Planctomycetota bacterium]